MRADSSQPRYTPSSVGGLMEPAFLRGARCDADGAPSVFRQPPTAAWSRLQTALQQVVTACRRRQGRA